MRVTIVGNGILGITTAIKLLEKDNTTEVTLIGDEFKKGSASIAAAAMFNSFCEIEPSTLSNEIERKKWLFNKMSNSKWKDEIKKIEESINSKINHGFGTFLINNHAADKIEDENFSSIINGLDEFEEPYEYVDTNEIKNYNPSPRYRASKAVFIKNEGWVNPFEIIEAYEKILKANDKFNYINARVKKLIGSEEKIEKVVTDNGKTIFADVFVLTNGADYTRLLDDSNLKFETPRIFYGVGCTAVIENNNNNISNCIRTPNRGLACGTYAAPRSQNSLVIGASNNIMDYPEYEPKITSIYALLKNLMEQINQDYYNSKLKFTKTGLRPTSEDLIPLIGSLSDNLFVATGTKRDGFHCSPIISEYISDLILYKTSKIGVDDIFNPKRKPLKYLTRNESIEKYIKNKIDAHFQHDFNPSKDSIIQVLIDKYEREANEIHDKISAIEWGIPIELYGLYKHNILK